MNILKMTLIASCFFSFIYFSQKDKVIFASMDNPKYNIMKKG